MLSSPDAALVQRDPALPGLALLFDPPALLAALRLHAPDNRSLHGIQSLQIAYIRYKPRTSCLIGYRAVADGSAPRVMGSDHIEKPAEGRGGMTIIDEYGSDHIEKPAEAIVLCAVAHRLDATDKLQKATKKPVVENVPKGIALGQGVVVSFFPDDRALKSLAHLTDPQTRTLLLKKLLPQHPDLWNATPRVLAYKPARRCVLRLRNEEHPENSVVLRFYTKSGFEASRGKARRFSSGGRLRFPQAVAKSSRHSVLVLEWLPGQPLNRVLEASNGSPDAACLAMEKVGAALAQLHSRSGKRLPLRTRETEARALLAAARGAGAVCPHLARRATKLARLSSVRLSEQAFAPRAMHGDFYASQVLLPQNASEPIALLDLDEAACGDPALDLGNFAAHLELDVLRGLLPAQHAKDFCAALLTGYNRAAKMNASDIADIALATAVGLMRLAPEPFRTHQPQWPEQTEVILARIESLLDSTTTVGLATSRETFATPPLAKSSTRFDDLSDAASDSAMPFLSQALDVEEAARRVCPLLGHPTRLMNARVTRHKAGRRCLIEYDFEAEDIAATPFTLIAKVRAKGLDETTYNLVRALRQSGWTENSADGIAVPEALGIVPEWRLWLMRKSAGQTMTKHLDASSGTELARRAADVLCKLHGSNLSAPRRHTIEDELRILHERLPQVAQLQPSWAARIHRVLEACDKLGARLSPSPSCGIHRDFYLDQVLVETSETGENRLWLLDLDLYSEGDPALDAGNFVGHLIESGLRSGGDANALQNHAAAFQNRFLELSPRCSQAAVEAYTTLTLARHIHISTRIEGRSATTQSLLELCEARLQIACHTIVMDG